MDTKEPAGGGGFPSTHWSRIYEASNYQQEAGSKALAELLTTYRPALQQSLQHRYPTTPREEIEDWVSAFIEKKVLQQHLLRNARKDKGKFRSYVLTALHRFAEDQRRAGERCKRQPSGGLVPYDEDHEPPLAVGSPHPDPGDRAWAVRVIEQARERTEKFYRDKGRHDSWAVFYEGCYLPLYQQASRPADAELARKHSLGSAREVSNAIITVKRRFGILLREVLREYASSEAEVDVELRELIAIVSDGG